MNNTTPEVHRSVSVPLPVAEAFRVFTEQFDLIKPREHNLMSRPVVSTVMEVRPGGRIFDRADDGTECVWGEVLYVEPPNLLRFAWLIGSDWQVQGKENASEVEVRFTANGPDRTDVRLHHHHLDRHGPAWASLVTALDGDNGWPLYLQRYAALADSLAAH